jgi:hypothetical protein
MTNDLDPHPANATAIRQTAKRKDTACSPFFGVGFPAGKQNDNREVVVGWVSGTQGTPHRCMAIK